MDVFERHLEVYSILLGKIFEAKTRAIILDNLLKNRGKIITKKVIIEDTGLEHFLTIRILREFSDIGLIKNCLVDVLRVKFFIPIAQ